MILRSGSVCARGIFVEKTTRNCDFRKVRTAGLDKGGAHLFQFFEKKCLTNAVKTYIIGAVSVFQA